MVMYPKCHPRRRKKALPPSPEEIEKIEQEIASTQATINRLSAETPIGERASRKKRESLTLLEEQLHQLRCRLPRTEPEPNDDLPF